MVKQMIKCFILLFFVLLFSLIIIPYEEVCKCVDGECTVSSNYLFKHNITQRSFSNTDNLSIKFHHERSVYYTLEPVFENDYHWRSSAVKDLNRIKNNKDITIHKYSNQTYFAVIVFIIGMFYSIFMLLKNKKLY